MQDLNRAELRNSFQFYRLKRRRVKDIMREKLKRFVSEKWLRVFVWASLVSQILIVVTGGGVRLTGSGLGCDDWPKCEDDSWVSVPEKGIHGVIEFGNRLLTFLLLAIALIALVAAFLHGKGRRIRGTSVVLVLGIFVQAVIGGISVLMDLNPWVVGLHFVVSAVMIAIASAQLWRTYTPLITTATRLERILSSLLLSFGAVTVLVGVVVTGSGPHAGDAETPRNGLDAELWQHFHSYPAYLTLGIAAMALFLVRRRDVDGYLSRITFWTFTLLVAQAVTGLLQVRLKLPIEIVIVHLTLASILVSLLTLQWIASRAPKIR
jgi:cytochrome c oxidase assembly protein subunit 15